jgi:hypothetical protein
MTSPILPQFLSSKFGIKTDKRGITANPGGITADNRGITADNFSRIREILPLNGRKLGEKLGFWRFLTPIRGEFGQKAEFALSPV